jgi:hypothetical protein
MIERPAKWLRNCPRRSLLEEIERFRAGSCRTTLVSDYPSRAKLVALDALHLSDVVVASGSSATQAGPDGPIVAAEAWALLEPCLMIGDRTDAGAAAPAARMAFRLIA